jgi:hypothetical protein
VARQRTGEQTVKYFPIILTALCAICSSALAGSHTSASYTITTDSTDIAGTRTQSLNYRTDSSAGGIGGLSTASPVATTVKHGYAGQLYDIVGLSITAPPSASLNEATSRQLVAAPRADDATTLAALNPSTVAWSIVSGPISGISSGGLASAGNVYIDTAALIGGSAQALSGQFNLTVLNVGNDDFGIYANDQIDDSWQVQFFGENNPNAGPTVDFDGTGQTNLFKFVAGLNPLDGSRFLIAVSPVPGQPGQKSIVFSPIVAGRNYTVQGTSTLPLPASWSPLSSTSQLPDNGAVRTVTDLSASPAPKFYRVSIVKP